MWPNEKTICCLGEIKTILAWNFLGEFLKYNNISEGNKRNLAVPFKNLKSSLDL